MTSVSTFMRVLPMGVLSRQRLSVARLDRRQQQVRPARPERLYDVTPDLVPHAAPELARRRRPEPPRQPLQGIRRPALLADQGDGTGLRATALGQFPGAGGQADGIGRKDERMADVMA